MKSQTGAPNPQVPEWAGFIGDPVFWVIAVAIFVALAAIIWVVTRIGIYGFYADAERSDAYRAGREAAYGHELSEEQRAQALAQLSELHRQAWTQGYRHGSKKRAKEQNR